MMLNISNVKSSTLFFVFIFCFLFYSNAQRVNRYNKNSYKFATIEDFYSVVNKDTFRLKELRFSGVHDRYYIQKGMYDRFGKWEQSVYKKQYDTLLIWNDVRILKNSDKLFKIAAKGHRVGVNVYTAVLVFDENNNDMFGEDSVYKEQLANYFANLIKTNDDNKVDFYIDFWEMLEKENKNSRHIIFMKNKYEKIKKKNLRRKLKKKN